MSGEASSLPAEMTTVTVRADEAALLASKRCPNCGHLWALHNAHCCAFCTIDKCDCTCSEGCDFSIGDPT